MGIDENHSWGWRVVTAWWSSEIFRGDFENHLVKIKKSTKDVWKCPCLWEPRIECFLFLPDCQRPDVLPGYARWHVHKVKIRYQKIIMHELAEEKKGARHPAVASFWSSGLNAQSVYIDVTQLRELISVALHSVLMKAFPSPQRLDDFPARHNRNKQPVPPVAVKIHSYNTNSNRNHPSRVSFITFFAVVDQWFGPWPQEAPKPDSDGLKLPHSNSRTLRRPGSSVPLCLSGLTPSHREILVTDSSLLGSGGGLSGVPVIFRYYIPSLASTQNS